MLLLKKNCSRKQLPHHHSCTYQQSYSLHNLFYSNKYYDSCVLTSNKKQPTVPHTTEDFYESLDSVGHCTLFVVVFSLCLTYLLLLSLLIKNSATYSISTKPFFLLFWFLLFFDYYYHFSPYILLYLLNINAISLFFSGWISISMFVRYVFYRNNCKSFNRSSFLNSIKNLT